MSTRNKTRAALASATALQGITVSPDPTPVAPVVTTDAQPMPADATKTNIALPSKRALAMYAAGLEMAVAGTDMSANGRGMIAAAIVDYCLNSLKWNKRDAITTAQGNADPKDGKLAQYHASTVNVFFGPRPPQASRKQTLSQQHAADALYKEFARQQFQITQASDVALCLIADGCTMRDYDTTTGLWNMHGALFCEDGCKPADTKARYTMQRCRADADYVPCVVASGDGKTQEATQMRRDATHYVAVASLRHAMLSQSANAQAKRESKTDNKRAPHRNTMTSSTKSEAVKQVVSLLGGPSVIEAPALVTPGTEPQPTPGYDRGMVTNGNTTTAPFDADTKATFAANILATRRAILALCEAPNVVSIVPERFIARVGPSSLPSDAWQAWMDVVAMVHAWEVLHGATKVKAVSAPTSPPVVSTEPTKVNGVVLSTPTKADKPAKVAA